MNCRTSEFLDTLESFLASYLPVSVGVSPNTIKSYKDAFRLLLIFMYEERQISADKVRFSDLNYETILSFLAWLESERGCGIKTRNQRLSALSSFSNYAQNRSFDAATAFRSSVKNVPSKKSDSIPRSTFTLEEIPLLLSMPKIDRDLDLRDRTLLSVMYASGARAQEICDLTVGDVQICDGVSSLTLLGKGSKRRKIGIPKACAMLLENHIRRHGISENRGRHVFSSQTHEHMSTACIKAIFTKYVRLAHESYPNLFNEKCYTPHSMRHSTASHMLEAGVPLIVIKNFLGHSSLQSTQIYAEVTQSTINKHIKAWSEKWGPTPVEPINEADPKQLIPDFLKTKINNR